MPLLSNDLAKRVAAKITENLATFTTPGSQYNSLEKIFNAVKLYADESDQPALTKITSEQYADVLAQIFLQLERNLFSGKHKHPAKEVAMILHQSRLSLFEHAQLKIQVFKHGFLRLPSTDALLRQSNFITEWLKVECSQDAIVAGVTNSIKTAIKESKKSKRAVDKHAAELAKAVLRRVKNANRNKKLQLFSRNLTLIDEGYKESGRTDINLRENDIIANYLLLLYVNPILTETIKEPGLPDGFDSVLVKASKCIQKFAGRVFATGPLSLSKIKGGNDETLYTEYYPDIETVYKEKFQSIFKRLATGMSSAAESMHVADPADTSPSSTSTTASIIAFADSPLSSPDDLSAAEIAKNRKLKTQRRKVSMRTLGHIKFDQDLSNSTGFSAPAAKANKDTLISEKGLFVPPTIKLGDSESSEENTVDLDPVDSSQEPALNSKDPIVDDLPFSPPLLDSEAPDPTSELSSSLVSDDHSNSSTPRGTNDSNLSDPESHSELITSALISRSNIDNSFPNNPTEETRLFSNSNADSQDNQPQSTNSTGFWSNCWEKTKKIAACSCCGYSS